MSPIDVVVAAVAIVVGAIGGFGYARHRRARRNRGAGRVRRILLPFTGNSISRRSLDAALRLARAEDATLVPAFLATVPRHLPLEAAVPAACMVGMPLLEAIERRRRARRSRSTRGSGADARTATPSPTCSRRNRSTA